MSNDESDKKFDIESYWKAIQGKWVRSDEPQRIVEAKAAKSKFKRDLEKGQASEHSFFMKFQQHLTHTDGRKGDFEINKNGEVLELKADYHDPKVTFNFFIEKFSHGDKPGGPFQAKLHGVAYYAYWFPSDDLLYLFNVNQLVKRINKLEPTLRKHAVKNEGYITTGYIVERALLEDLCLDPNEVILNGK